EEDASTLKELGRKYNTEQLIEYLKGQKQVKETNEITLNRNYLRRVTLSFQIDWSYNHYISWTDKNMNKETINRTFYKVLEIMDNDQNISQGIHNVIQGLLKK
ncbi:10961_t:CDS:2, partial [Gigaspora rosea]